MSDTPTGNFDLVYGQIVARSWADPDFKRRVESSPREVLAEYGLVIPDDVAITVVRESSSPGNAAVAASSHATRAGFPLRCPRLKSHYRIVPMPPHSVFLLAEERHFVLTGRSYAAVIPLLDGSRTPEVLSRELADRLTPAEIFYVLGQLLEQGHIAESVSALAPAAAAFWDERGLDPAKSEAQVRGSVRVVGCGGADPGPMRAALGCREETSLKLTVVVAADYLDEELEAINREALALSRPWMLVKPYGSKLYLGPLFVPGQTACWQCLAERLQENREVESYLRGLTDLPPVQAAALPSSSATFGAACQLAANQVSLWLAGDRSDSLEDRLVSIDVHSLATERHFVQRLPHCPACGQPELRVGRPLELKSSPVEFDEDGGHRSVSPEATFARYCHLVSPLTGVIPRLESGPGLSAGSSLHVYTAGVNLARRCGSLDALQKGLRTHSSGKGKTEAQARTGALCESIERHSSMFQVTDHALEAAFRELSDAAIHPNRCLLFSERQYAERTPFDERRDQPFHYVPPPFDETLTLEWTSVWSLTHGCNRLLPSAFCFLNFPRGRGEPSIIGDSNGNASGNTLEEAIVQGFFELVERDCVAVWWYNRVQRPEIDLSSVGDPWLEQVRCEYQRLGRELWVLELTHDLAIPTFAALSRRTGKGAERIIFGFGSHLDRRVGITRAVAELNQFLGFADSVDLHSSVGESVTRDWFRDARLDDHRYLQPLGLTRESSRSPRRFADSRDCVLWCQEQVEKAGLEMLVLDLTRPAVGMPVAKVIVPGLRHFWNRFAPGRLYDVPVRLGWCAAATPEDRLNPIPIFL